MSDLLDFLNDRLAQDEETARSLRQIEPEGAARLLREVDAKRRILVDHSTPHTVDGDFCVQCGELGPDGHQGENWKAEDWCNWHGDNACPTLLALAYPWSDHPDFKKEWRLPPLKAQ
jgi:hypothetical protein